MSAIDDSQVVISAEAEEVIFLRFLLRQAVVILARPGDYTVMQRIRLIQVIQTALSEDTGEDIGDAA